MLSLALVACGDRVSPDTLARTDVALRDAATDVGVQRDVADVRESPDVVQPRACPAPVMDQGRARGHIRGTMFDYRYAWAGYERFGSHSCPKLAVRFAPTDDIRSTTYVEFIVNIPNNRSVPVIGTHQATLVYVTEMASLEFPATVEIRRADALVSGVDAAAFLATARAVVATATSDVVAEITDVPECSNFVSMCL